MFYNGPKSPMDPNFNQTSDNEARALTLNLTKVAVSNELTHLAPASSGEINTTISVEAAINGMIAECRASAEEAVVAALGKREGQFSNSSKGKF